MSITRAKRLLWLVRNLSNSLRKIFGEHAVAFDAIRLSKYIPHLTPILFLSRLEIDCMLRTPTLLLIRHAQSENNAKPDHLRVSDPSITPLGVRQSQKLATAVKMLGPTVLYCSPFARSLETTKPIWHATGITPNVRQDIYEQGGCHSGYVDGYRTAQPGMSRNQIQEKYLGWQLDDRIYGDGWYDLDHYETLGEARHRAQRVMKWLVGSDNQHQSEDCVALVIHADFKLRLLEVFLESPDLEHRLGDVVNTAITRLTMHAGRWRMDYWNVHSHLGVDEVSV
jgi:2,3-bisphosphoglycerate-dependent phosphoglycerate mutase